MAIAKGIGSGFPLGACLATEKAASGMNAGSHGSTYGGNPLAMAVGNAVLDVMLADGFLGQVQRIAGVLRKRLAAVAAAHPKTLAGVRGLGLLIGLECVRPNTDLMAGLRRNGLLCVGAGENVIRLLPPLIIDETHVEEAAQIVDRSCRELEQ
jgi:acetylornithine/N-succinyldiaminopimelate aminotransferase